MTTTQYIAMTVMFHFQVLSVNRSRPATILSLSGTNATLFVLAVPSDGITTYIKTDIVKSDRTWDRHSNPAVTESWSYV